MVETIRFRIEAGEAGQRLDKLLVRHVPGLGRREAAELFSAGKVRVGGRPVKKAVLAREGDELTVEREALLDSEAAPALVVRIETAHYVVVSKPAGQPSVPRRGGEPRSLAAALLRRYPELDGIGYRPGEPGLVHRLDTQTSGLLLAARSDFGFRTLTGALKAGAIDKRYLAIVEQHGLTDSGSIDLPLAPARRGSRRVVADPEQEHAGSATHFRVLERRGVWALLEISVSRAYRHQVRVHLASLGHPIAGDTLYGGPAAPELGARHALHGSRLAWPGTSTLAGFEVDEPMPDDMRRLLST